MDGRRVKSAIADSAFSDPYPPFDQPTTPQSHGSYYRHAYLARCATAAGYTLS